jgi:hypothetical protein
MNPWKSEALKTRQYMDPKFTTVLKAVESRRARGFVRQSVANDCLDTYQSNQKLLVRHSLQCMLGETVGCGSDAPAAAMLTILLCLSHNTDIQKKARLEIDAVCGTSR